MADIPIRAGDGSEAHDETPIVVDEFPRVPTEISPPSAMPLPPPSTHESRDALLGALHRAGLDADMLGPIAEGLARGDQLEALLLKSFGALVAAPPLLRRAGSLLVVSGAGGSARALAAAVAADIGVDPAEVPFASLDPEAHTVMTHSRLVRSTEEAGESAPGWRRSQVAVVVVDAPVTARLSWAAHMITTLRPTAVWGIVDATSKDEDIASGPRRSAESMPWRLKMLSSP